MDCKQTHVWILAHQHVLTAIFHSPAYFTMTDDPSSWGSFILLTFVDTNASYFMSLFFFYSGYFVPKSYDKKGKWQSQLGSSLTVIRPHTSNLPGRYDFLFLGSRDWTSRLWFTHSSLGHTCNMDWLMFSSGSTFLRGIILLE